MPAEIHWRDDRHFRVAEIEFECDATGAKPPAPASGPRVLLKARAQVEFYLERFSKLARVLEFGVYRGGSAAFLAAAFDLERYVGIDLAPPAADFDAWRAQHPLGRRLGIHYQTSQADRERVAAIIAEEFRGAPIDLVVDDASHDYARTKAAFETAFPYLKPGGAYVIEDWGWAHHPPHAALWPGRPVLSNLLFELAMAAAGSPSVIGRIVVDGGAFATVFKAETAPLGGALSLDSLYRVRGKAPALPLSAPE